MYIQPRQDLRDLAFVFVAFVFALALFGCAKQSAAKHFAMLGKVMSVDKMGHNLVIEHDAIPGFMDAMTMPYPVSDNEMLERVGAGDEIKADLKVQGESIAIDKLEVVKKASPRSTPAPATQMHVPQSGEQVPNFALTNQSGRRVHLEITAARRCS